MIMKKICVAAMALMLLMFCAALCFAAEQPQNNQVDEQILQLEQKYDIRITYEVDENRAACIGTGSLTTLDVALDSVTPTVVKQVSDYYEKKNGSKLKYSFVYTPFHKAGSMVELLGRFDEKTSIIEIYLPTSSKGTFTTGENPITIVHEFAHAFYQMFCDSYGVEKLNKEWIALNKGVKYNEGYLAYAYNKVTFISSYAATSVEEDFADTFAHAFVRHKDGQGFSHRLLTGDQKTALGEKVDYIESMLPKYLASTELARANLRRIHQTEVFLYYQGIRLSGEKLQFIGCSYPRYVLNGILSTMKIKAKNTEWLPDIGGWQVSDNAEKYYLIFPGGCFVYAREPIEDIGITV